MPNLLFAGRNISVTHAALSSTRVMGTTAVLGQAAGTAAALCARHRCDPRSLSGGERLRELQATLMEDDCWLPGRRREASELARTAKLDGTGDDAPALLDGTDRDRPEVTHAWTGRVGQDGVEYRWDTPRLIGGARLIFDSNLDLHKRMPCTYPHRSAGACAVPASLVKAFRLEACDRAERWTTVHRETGNYQRVVQVPLGGIEAGALRLVPEETWGGTEEARIFAFEPVAQTSIKLPPYPDGPSFAEIRSKVDPHDLAAPDNGLEDGVGKRERRTAA